MVDGGWWKLVDGLAMFCVQVAVTERTVTTLASEAAVDMPNGARHYYSYCCA